MFRIWGRIEREHKIVRQTTYESTVKFEWSDFLSTSPTYARRWI